MDKHGIPGRLRDARKRLNLNQLVIASDLGIQQKTISEIENGKILNIPNTYIYYFYKKGISLEWIYDDKGSMMINDNAEEPEDEKKNQAFSIGSALGNSGQYIAGIATEETKSEGADGEINNYGLFERIIDSKDFTIKALMAYIQSLENNLAFLKNLLASKKS